MPYTITKDKPTIHKYKGYKYELPNNKYKWIPDNWYETRATKAEQDLVNHYVEIIYKAVKYITDKNRRLMMIDNILDMYDMPTLEFNQHIINRFYKTKTVLKFAKN